MKLASYLSTPSGALGVLNRLIRLRFGGSFIHDGVSSHCEIVFEPGDGVDDLMPDLTTQPDANGAYWCASSTMMDRIPSWSSVRAGKLAGVRFKRIAVHNSKWQLNDLDADERYAALWMHQNEGQVYGYMGVLGFAFWPANFLIRKNIGETCASACAKALRYDRGELFHPEILRVMTERRD